MQCTQCKQGDLSPTFIDSLFRAHECKHCGGNWILIEDFLSWKEKNPNHQFNDSIDISEEAEDTTNALLCPVSGTIMTKYRISATTDHKVDYSNAAGGIWLDKGEWQLLKQEGLAGSLNSLVTGHWQNKLRQTTTQNNFEELYKSKFGEENYETIKAFREWLNQQEQKADMRAYILAENPYSAH